MLWLTVSFLCLLILCPSSFRDLFFGSCFCGHAYDGSCAESLLAISFLKMTLGGRTLLTGACRSIAVSHHVALLLRGTFVAHRNLENVSYPGNVALRSSPFSSMWQRVPVVVVCLLSYSTAFSLAAFVNAHNGHYCCQCGLPTATLGVLRSSYCINRIFQEH